MARKCRITTIDNPFDPFSQFDSWYAFDVEKGYYTCSRIARLANFTDEMTDIERDNENEKAIDKLIEIDVLDIYKKVVQEE
jgi:hypothetical protein